MSQHAKAVRSVLLNGTMSARQLAEKIGVSQPTISRAISELGDELIRIGAARSIHYAIRDPFRSLPDIPVYRVSVEGTIKKLGTLIPVCPEGFVMRQEDGSALHSDGLPWWMFDMLPQGYLGRAYAARHAVGLGLSAKLNEWTDTQALRALLAHGYDTVGNLLLGDAARDFFLNAAEPNVICEEQKIENYARLAWEASRGEVPGSSAGGEQPKFTAYVITPSGARHVLVKFSEPENNSVTERWRDLLLAEHLALEVLRQADLPSVKTRIFDHGHQRFLEVERFDRVAKRGRRAVHSLKALDAEFVGNGVASWPTIVRQLAKAKLITAELINTVSVLWAFGKLIGNTDMHNGNLSFMAERDRPFDLAPAYDMTPMAFAPRSGGGLPDSIPELNIDSSIDNQHWAHALTVAREYLSTIRAMSNQFSDRFQPCIAALEEHIGKGAVKIGRLD